MKRTYKVLIADDEYWTREKFRNMINWKEYSLSLLKPASDGEEVLQRMAAEKPDILITDINMPFVNGVELLNVIQQDYPEVVTFVISGYNDFEYVKETLLSGAINYLIKPVSKMDLVSALSKALEIIGQRESEEAAKEKENSQLLKAASLLQDREFSQLIRKEDAFTSAIMMCNNLDFAGTSLMLIKIHNLKGLSQQYQYDINLLSYHIKKEIRAKMRTDEITVFNHIYRPNEFLIVSELDSVELKKGAERVLVYISNAAKSPVTICISEHSYTMERLNNAYTQTIALLMTRAFHKNNEIVICEEKREQILQPGYISGYFKEEYENQIYSFLESGNKKALKKLILDTSGLMACESDGWSYLQVKQTVKRIVNIVLEYAARRMPPEQLADVENMPEIIDVSVEFLDAAELCRNMESLLDMVVVPRDETATDSIKEMAVIAARYIDAHYFENLTLSSLAEKYNVESSYFSKVFRQEVGENMMLYITRRRVKKAVELMGKEEINLTEIAYMVGYDDYTYFSRVFKKVMKVSPREYRNGL